VEVAGAHLAAEAHGPMAPLVAAQEALVQLLSLRLASGELGSFEQSRVVRDPPQLRLPMPPSFVGLLPRALALPLLIRHHLRGLRHGHSRATH
jgi:hypothetical protein